ncbi:MAG TPA: ATP-dependent DNA helicase RecG [Pseudolysinimonas sp.]|nr:ATP-dependent DNA helicase RecG [Pseudolysinimonas sp.]
MALAPYVPSPFDVKLASALGGRTAQAITKAFGYQTVGEFLAHYPRRYAKRGELTSLAELTIDEAVTIVAEVRSVTERPMRQKRGSILEVSITDGRGFLTLTFFNQRWRAAELKPGVRGIFAGKVGEYRGARQLAHPDYELFTSGEPTGAPALDSLGATAPVVVSVPTDKARQWAEQPIPIYPATSTLASWQLGKAMEVALGGLPADVEDPVPDDVRAARGLLPFGEALRLVHRPSSDADWKRAQDSLRFQEAFVLQAGLLRQRAERRSVGAAPRVPGRFSAEFEEKLPFTLTHDQVTVGGEIERDLAGGVPMNRLVQGEVGSGKTLVALRAMLAVADSGGQSAFLAPTEVLAGQHLRSLVSSLGPDLAARLRPTLLTGQLPAADRRRALLATASGGAAIVVGTHALLGDQVTFADLGLVVVDEQHRFGVDQREALRLKGASPHVLVLTATPIPRTVAMTVFGDLDVSTIAELPAGRSPIVSHVVALADHPGWENRIWERLAEELAQGRQGFVVCPAIDIPAADATAAARRAAAEDDPDALADPDAPPGAAVLPTLEQLRAHPLLRDRRIEPLHGRMSADEKDRTMRAFAAGEIDVLVATTVIEVGVDVPNASTMVVLDADRFGVAQLHQLRGRVGRGAVPGLCLFVTRSEPSTVSRERVDAVAATLDGFVLAQVDLELRREGNVLGANQSGGRSSLKLLRVVRDGDLIAEARVAAEAVLEADPSLADHPALAGALARRLDEAERAFLAKG